MSEQTHTPGPWRVSDFEKISKHRVVMGSDGFSICLVGERDKDENIANARLIAAAPELLRQLQALVGQIRQSPYLLVPPNVESAINQALYGSDHSEGK